MLRIVDPVDEVLRSGEPRLSLGWVQETHDPSVFGVDDLCPPQRTDVKFSTVREFDPVLRNTHSSMIPHLQLLE